MWYRHGKMVRPTQGMNGVPSSLLYTKQRSRKICSHFICVKKLQRETQGTALTSYLLGTWVPRVGQVLILLKKEWVCGSEAGGGRRESQNSAPRLQIPMEPLLTQAL